MISIVIPSFNQQEYLCDAIDSALAQKNPYLNVEIIVVDDGSTDNSLEIARKYEPKIKVVSQVNKGLSSARNTGIMNARGQYVLFLDADDILMDGAVKKIQETIKTTNADVIAPSFKEFGMSNAKVILMPNPTIEDFKVGNRIGYCTAVKKEVLLEVGGFSPRMTWGAEDYHLWFDLLKRGKKIVTIPDVLWLYRTKQNSMWTETAKHRGEYMEQIVKDHPSIFVV